MKTNDEILCDTFNVSKEQLNVFFYDKMIEAMNLAKKEVFDDIEPKINDLYPYCLRKDEFEEIKKRHLSTFADGKSDIINANVNKKCGSK